ncbi:MAG: hypothetical protein QXD94_03125 [Sulfolobales archaeon]
MLVPTYAKVLSFMVYVLMVMNLANVMVVQKDVVLSNINDGILINYQGKDQIYVLTSDLSDAFLVDVVNTSSEGKYSGSIYMKLVKQVYNLSDSYFLVVLYSSSPYTINISVINSKNSLVDILNSPGNVSLQLTFRLVNNLSGSYGVPSIQIPFYLRAPTWNVAIILIILSLFITTAVLDVRSYSVLRRDRWGIEESIALVIRYLLYGSLVAFLACAITTVGLAIYNNLLYRSFNLEISWLLVPFLILFVNGVAYYICKWKGWYDVIDEE